MTAKDTGVHLASNGDYWQAWWWDDQGNRIRKGIGAKSGMSRAAAMRECRRIHREHILNPDSKTVVKSPTLASWRARYGKIRTDISPDTLALHGYTFDKLEAEFGKTRRLDQITRANAATWRARLVDGGLTDQTVCAHVRNAKVIYKWAIDDGAVAVNPFARLRGTPPKVGAKFVQLSHDQVQAILDACPNAAWRALIGLCWYAGLRRNEALSMTWACIQWGRNRLIVRTVDRKQTTKRRDREVLMEPALATLLLDCRESIDGPLVVPAGTYRPKRLASIIGKSSVPKYAKPLHTLRKNRQTLWATRYPEFVVNAWLGNSLEVAREHYLAVPSEFYDATILPHSAVSRSEQESEV